VHGIINPIKFLKSHCQAGKKIVVKTKNPSLEEEQNNMLTKYKRKGI
jgi:hypothetical protein